jgi:hypothetical protein
MKTVGRPRLQPGVSLMIFTFVELMRDRQETRLRRFSERDGCRRLQRTLKKEFIGGFELKFPTIRRHYSDVKDGLRDGRVSQAHVNAFLALGRTRREILGWESSPWLWLMDPDLLSNYQVTLLGNGKIKATRTAEVPATQEQ